MNERLTLQDLIDLLAEKKNITKKDAENFLRELINLVTETIQDKDFVRVKDFGTFKLTLVNARKSVNVNTGEDINIPPHYRLNFTPDKLLRESVNKPFAHFESVLLNDDVDFSDLDVFDETTNKQVSGIEEPDDESTDIDEDFIELEDIVEEEIVFEDEKVTPTETKDSNHKNIIKKEIIVFEEVKPQVTSTEQSLNQNITEKTTVVNEVILNEEEQTATTIQQTTEAIEEKNIVEEKQPLASHDQSTFVEREEYTENDIDKIESETVEDDDIINFEKLLNEEKGKRKKLTISIGILVACILGIWLLYNLFSNKNTRPDKSNIPQLAIVEESSEENNNQDNTSHATDYSDNSNEGNNSKHTNVEQASDNRTATYQANSNIFESKTVTIKQGQTMNSLGREYLGNPAFWVYIFEENYDKLKSPDAIYAGMEIKIPDPKKYNIDPNNAASVEKAKTLAAEIIRKYK